MSASSQSLRVIGGEYRGRRLEFVAAEGLRPTSDRIRETLFNWLQPVISGARCLDMFAGSGLLGIEALSRGAAEVVFIEQHKQAAEQLRRNLQVLGSEAGIVMNADALHALTTLQGGFDIIFADPPFSNDLLLPACKLVQQYQLLRPAGRIYLESEQEVQQDDLPDGWQLIRSKKAGQVYYYLASIDQADL